MASITQVKQNMPVLGRGGLPLSPFGLLVQAFAEEIRSHAGGGEGFYDRYDLEFFQEDGGAPKDAPTFVQLRMDLKLVLQQLRERGYGPAAVRIVEKALSVRSNYSRAAERSGHRPSMTRRLENRAWDHPVPGTSRVRTITVSSRSRTITISQAVHWMEGRRSNAADAGTPPRRTAYGEKSTEGIFPGRISLAGRFSREESAGETFFMGTASGRMPTGGNQGRSAAVAVCRHTAVNGIFSHAAVPGPETETRWFYSAGAESRHEGTPYHSAAEKARWERGGPASYAGEAGGRRNAVVSTAPGERTVCYEESTPPKEEAVHPMRPAAFRQKAVVFHWPVASHWIPSSVRTDLTHDGTSQRDAAEKTHAERPATAYPALQMIYGSPLAALARNLQRTVGDPSVPAAGPAEKAEQTIIQTPSLKLEEQTVWQNPYMRAGPVEMDCRQKPAAVHRERPEPRISDAEVRRTADKVFKLVREKILTERRRIGRI